MPPEEVRGPLWLLFVFCFRGATAAIRLEALNGLDDRNCPLQGDLRRSSGRSRVLCFDHVLSRLLI